MVWYGMVWCAVVWYAMVPEVTYYLGQMQVSVGQEVSVILRHQSDHVIILTRKKKTL